MKRQVCLYSRTLRRYGDNVGHAQPSARLEDTAGLSQYSFLVGAEIDDAVRNDDVECRVAKREMFDFGLQEVHDRDTSVGSVATGKANHFGRHVDADDAPSPADLDGRG